MAIDRSRDALIVVDLQPDFMPGGPLAVAEGDRIAAPIGRLAAGFSTVVATQDWHPAGHVSFAERGGPWPPHCVAGSAGADVHAALPDALVTSKVRKGTHVDVDSYSALSRTTQGARHRAGRLPARARHRAALRVRAGARLLRARHRHRRRARRLRGLRRRRSDPRGRSVVARARRRRARRGARRARRQRGAVGAEVS